MRSSLSSTMGIVATIAVIALAGTIYRGHTNLRWTLKPVSVAANDGSKQSTREPLPMVRLESGMAGRTSVNRGTYKVMVVHLPTRHKTHDELRETVVADPSTDDDDLVIFEEPKSSPWHVPSNRLHDLTTFNCATYAIGDAIGLTQNDWLEPMPTSWTSLEGPAATVLKHEYRHVSTTAWGPNSHITTSDLPDVQAGDVVALVNASRQRGYVHFAIVQNLDGELQLVSKLGTGPFARGTLRQTCLHFPAMVDQVQVHRRRAI